MSKTIDAHNTLRKTISASLFNEIDNEIIKRFFNYLSALTEKNRMGLNTMELGVKHGAHSTNN